MYRLTRNPKYKDGSLKGIAYLLDSQKENGGWRGWYVDAITFNDEVTTGALDCQIVQNGVNRLGTTTRH